MLIVARLLVFLALLVVGVSIPLYLATKNPRYLGFAWAVVKFCGVFIIVLAALFLVERLILFV